MTASKNVVCHYCHTLEDKNKVYWVSKWAYEKHTNNWEYGVACCAKCLSKEKGNYNAVLEEPKPPKTRKKK